MKKILVTNDDGIDADGIIRLAREAKNFGEVWVVAPLGQRSAASHSITLRDAIDIYPHEFPVEGVHAYSCSGTPADCVRVGGLSVMPEKPDIVLSGINFGYNSATDIQYSATCGAAFEGAFQGAHSIALSEGFSDRHVVTDRYLHEVLEEAISMELGYGQIVNINFPDCELDDCKGIKRDCKVSRRGFYVDSYKALEKLENGGIRYMVDGIYNENAEENTDFRAIVDKYVSIGTVNNVGV